MVMARRMLGGREEALNIGIVACQRRVTRRTQRIDTLVGAGNEYEYE
jgi:hypothetical protein